jgi:4-cresol dehydrogenase (hydroxylating)
MSYVNVEPQSPCESDDDDRYCLPFFTEPEPSALAELQAAIGEQHVLTNRDVIGAYERATFATTQRIPLVVLPGSVQEVQAVVRIANRHRIPIYPISRGRNWGLGSRVPVRSGCCIIDLKRMNRILDFDEQNAVLTIEPGVTFEQVAKFLEERGSSLYLAAIGGPPDASVLANALERGDGVGPLGDRARYCTGLEVVLPTGERLSTGLAAFEGSLSGKLAQFGPGPGLEGLFFQSNLGIVTRMSVFLARRPRCFQLLVFAARSEAEVTAATTALKELQQLGVLTDNGYSLWNVYRFLSAQIKYPWDAVGGKPVPPRELLEHLPKAWKGVQWVGFVGIYSPSRLHAVASRHMVRRALRSKVSRCFVMGPLLARVLRLFQRPLRRLTGVDVGKMVDNMYFRSVFLGHPTRLSASSIYWRKRLRGGDSAPADVDPDRDRSGLHWICPALPFDGAQIVRVTRTVEEIAFRHGLEPMCMFFNPSQWYLKSFIVIMFDQEVPEEQEAARACHDEILTTLDAMGYPPVRLGIQSMRLAAPSDAVHVDAVRRLKQQFDPNDILAPGRYDFRHCWAGHQIDRSLAGPNRVASSAV